MRHAFLIALLVILPGTSLATTFYAPLPELVGVIDFIPGIGSREASFDFGQQFAEIERVSIEIKAHVRAQQFDVCGTVFDPQPCVHQVKMLGFFLEMDQEDKPFLGTIFAGVSISDDPNAIEASGTGDADFVNPLNINPFGWDILLDGQGSLSLAWNALLTRPGFVIRDFKEASGKILGARLVIEGTPVPEPSTALLLMAGMALLSAAGRRSPLAD